jgi:hypothetical protein
LVKKIVKIVAIALVLLFLLIQFVRPDRNNPPVNPADTLAATVAVPDNVKAVLARSCADCHSNETTYPWYSNVAPFSWLLADHIRDGRRELNISEWGTYPVRKKTKKLEEICEQVKEGEMPLPSYLWIHRDAALTDADRGLLCDWANAERAKMEQ